jgi:alpha-tubulin suppressor-like RCC1 family protein
MLLVCAFLLLTLLLPFQAAAAEASSAVVAESSNSGVTMVAAGGDHTLALKQDGTVWSWGNNEYGQLGDGTTIDRYTPVQVQGLDSVVDISAGSGFSLALKSDGTVWAWGNNWNGQRGDSSVPYRYIPVQVTSLSSVVAIASGHYHNLAVKSDGTVWAWGWNIHGLLGDGKWNIYDAVVGEGSMNGSSSPVQVQGLGSVVDVAAGKLHSLALKSDGTVWAWGNNDSGQHGVPGGLTFNDGPYTTTYRHTPVQVQGLDSVVAFAAGYSHSLALKNDGTVWAWGSNSYGQLGDGSTTTRYTPVQVTNLGLVTAIAAGSSHTLALKSDGTVWTWGDNSSGELGDGSTTTRYTPVQVTNLDSVSTIATNDGSHSLAVKSDGTVWAWGWNGYGQLGDGTYTTRYIPVQVASPEAPQWLEYYALTVTDVTYNSVQLNWKPATDETGVDKYLVYQENTLLATLNGDVNSYEVKGLSPSSSYLFSLVAVDADGNRSAKKEVTVTTAAYTAPGSFQLSDSKTYSDGWYNYEFSLYYGYISSPGEVLSGSWSPPEGFHGVVKVSMGSPEGENYDLSLETVGEGNRLPEDTTLLTGGTEYSATEVPSGYKAEWRVKGHTGNDFSPDKKVFVYVSIKYDNH